MLYIHIARAYQRHIDLVADNVVKCNVARASQHNIETVGIQQLLALKIARPLQFDAYEIG